MEGLALKWVNRCEFNHPNVSKFPLYKNIGQNLALSGGYTPNLTQIVQDWYKERKYYSYANNSCSRVCSHYTQVSDLCILCPVRKKIHFLHCQYDRSNAVRLLN
uniref:SCP domain-containing protein n=1 Tax=Mesocestoides corti TaxID=53468 RepID=A0A5K3FDQ0_MESCO